DRLGELAHVLLDALSLVRKRERRAAFGESLRDRPSDRAAVGDPEDEPALAGEISQGARESMRSRQNGASAQVLILFRPLTCRPVRIAVVTGGSSGIGAATARTLTDRGWRCIILARNAERLEQV